ncbi:DUF3124 domain-containing protein [Microcoleus sp. FACHB-1515]|uniref:DUF3124 domain-containing protein n=1 Tax=Cyanophyceae TaxID=3028117 RepID=UPI001685B462|nr:DUF3124 domain-containing protein [Microcoleus sp. FACHB-1515]MBD2089829.1 DUF3124 domain-containing protein [Microcoleus sp. FACHB-1515]
MKQFLCSCVVLVILLTACTTSEPPADPIADLKPITLDSTVKIVAGQTVYVPIYSHIYTWERSRTMDLTATLSVRNTDLANPIILTAVNYYDSNGKLVRNYLEQPAEISPMASTSFVVDQADASGGSGAAFIVEWVTEKQVSTPVIEAVMINAAGNQGVSFVSPGRVIKSQVDNN